MDISDIRANIRKAEEEISAIITKLEQDNNIIVSEIRKGNIDLSGVVCRSWTVTPLGSATTSLKVYI